MARMTTPTHETANPSSSSKRTTGARHAYLSRNGVVVISAATYREALEQDKNERARMLIGTTDNGDDWQPPTQTTTRTVTTYSDRGSR